jgi:hypothetical protein
VQLTVRFAEVASGSARAFSWLILNNPLLTSIRRFGFFSPLEMNEHALLQVFSNFDNVLCCSVASIA